MFLLSSPGVQETDGKGIKKVNRTCPGLCFYPCTPSHHVYSKRGHTSLLVYLIYTGTVTTQRFLKNSYGMGGGYLVLDKESKITTSKLMYQETPRQTNSDVLFVLQTFRSNWDFREVRHPVSVLSLLDTRGVSSNTNYVGGTSVYKTKIP